MPMLNTISPVLPANDVLQTIAWYEQKLGFQRDFVYPSEQSPEYGAASRDGVEIHFSLTKVDPLKNDCSCYLRVAELEALYEEYKAKSVIHPNGPLESKPWGLKEFAVLDSNGTLLRFGEMVPSEGR
jgi:uncharacterized glyoxalase superfamily protein PhnB